MDEFASNIVQKFNFKPKYIYRKKYMYICNTDKGVKLIKPVNYTTDKILFVHNIKQHLIEKGFNQLDFYYMSQDNLPYVISEDILYVMTDYIDLDECDLSKDTDTKKAIELIANFHKLSQGYKLQNIETIKHDISNLDIKQVFLKKLENLKKMKRIVSKQKKLMDFELSFIKEYDYFYKNAVESIEILEKCKYGNLNKLANNNLMICHNRLKEENILIEQKSYLTQFESITIGHFIYDISSFIIRYIKKHSDDYLSLEEILTTYSKINYIDSNFLPILYALIKFPTRYIETCQSFFDRRRNFTPISISSDLQNILELKEFQENYISKIKY